jgi:hypothetical protein
MAAKLTLILKADDIIVAESDDVRLWRRVLGLIQGGGPQDEGTPLHEDEDENADKESLRFAKSLGISTDVLEGALSPSKEAPYLQLNHHHWEAFKKNFPSRGKGALNPTGLAATLLVLWFKEAKIDIAVAQALAAGVLKTINVSDGNPSRGINNTQWLKARGGGTITINPAEISKAQAAATAFCEKRTFERES